jgi:cytoskeleton protein RodZ
MASVAEQLRTAREAKNLTIQQIAEITNVRTDHIRAIEEGNYDVFSAPVYIRGFVRTYAKILKLDVPTIIAAVDAELGRTEKFSEPPPLTPQPRTIVDWVTLQFSKIDWPKAAILLGAVVVLAALWLGFKAWLNHRDSNPAAGVKPGVYHAPTNRPGDTLPLPQPAPRR